MAVTVDVPVLRLTGVSKSFGKSCVLSNFELDLHEGEVVALVGQNGSGKSTLIKILAGYHEPDANAHAEVRGVNFTLGDPSASKAANFRFVHQDLALVENLSSVENYALTVGYASRRSFIDWDLERDRVRERITRLGFDFDVDKPISQLLLGQRVGLAIARALADVGNHDGAGPAVLVLDEPTASLPPSEVAHLFGAVRAVRALGVPVLYVSHRLDEVFALADRIVVLRDGKTVGVCRTSETTHDDLVTLMLGNALEDVAATNASVDTTSSDVSLELQGLAGGSLNELNLTAGPGRIVGIAGVTGSGREMVGPLIVGSVPMGAGAVRIQGADLRRSTPQEARKAGIAYLPSDRKAKAAILHWTLRENLTLLDVSSFSTLLRIKRAEETAETRAWLRTLDVRPPDPETEIRTLSGGNQQKVIMGRLLRTNPKVIVVDEPTQGVDIGAKAAIHQLIRNAATNGAVVVVCSSDTEELVALADEILVLKDGRVGTRLKGDQISDSAVDRAILGASE